MNKKLRALLKRAVEIQSQLDCVKPLYRELDEIIEVLAASKFKDAKLEGIVIVLADNFSEKNVAFKATAFKRYDLKVVKEST